MSTVQQATSDANNSAPSLTTGSGMTSSSSRGAGFYFLCVLVEYQHALRVLLRGHHGVHDESVGCRSLDGDDQDGALEIETGAARRR